jgi:general secretion pathway protein B
MSYILDALRKSQQLRHPGSAPGPRGAVHNISLSLPGSGWWLVAGLMLLLGILAAVLIFWRSTVGNIPPVPAVPVATPAASMPATKPAPVVPEKTPPPLENPATNTSVVRDLAEEAKVPVRIAPTPPNVVRAPKMAAVPRRRTPAPNNAPAETLASDDTPLLQQMPAEFQRTLPPMTVTIHVYSQAESQRILFINNREYHQGNQIEGGIRVEEIVQDGVVLSYQGQRFKLSRPH